MQHITCSDPDYYFFFLVEFTISFFSQCGQWFHYSEFLLWMQRLTSDPPAALSPRGQNASPKD